MKRITPKLMTKAWIFIAVLAFCFTFAPSQLMAAENGKAVEASQSKENAGLFDKNSNCYAETLNLEENGEEDPDESYLEATYINIMDINGSSISCKAITTEPTTMVLDQSYEVKPQATVNHYMVWFKFTPAESGRYIFTSSYPDGEELDPCGNLLTLSENGERYEIIAGHSDGSNFKIGKTLEAGKTYYLWAGYLTSNCESSYTVTVTAAASLSKITVDVPTAKIRRSEVSDISESVTYADGSVSDCSISGYLDGYYTRYTVAEDQLDDWNDYKAGTYTLTPVIQEYDSQTSQYETVLTGEPFNITITAPSSITVTGIPTEAVYKYQFNHSIEYTVTFDDGSTGWDMCDSEFYSYIYFEADSDKESDWANGVAGTYTITPTIYKSDGFDALTDTVFLTGDPFEVTLKKTPSVSSMKVENADNITFVDGISRYNADLDITVTVTYDDGSTKILDFKDNDTDDYENSICLEDYGDNQFIISIYNRGNIMVSDPIPCEVVYISDATLNQPDSITIDSAAIDSDTRKAISNIVKPYVSCDISYDTGESCTVSAANDFTGKYGEKYDFDVDPARDMEVEEMKAVGDHTCSYGIGFDLADECFSGFKMIGNLNYTVVSSTPEEHTHEADLVAKVDSTCAKAGNEAYYKCKLCGKLFSDEGCTTEIAKIPVIATKAHTLKAVAAVAATETTAGNKAYYECTVCGKLYLDQNATKETTKDAVTLAKLTTVKTGTTLKLTSGQYKVTGTKAVTYTKATSAATVKVPATVKVNGVTYKVTSIANKAFYNNKKIKKVTIGSNVTSIGANAFAKCKKLTSLTIPAKVTKIGKNAFSGCTSLKKLTIKSKKMTSKTISKNAFKGIKAKTKVYVPGSKKKAYKKLFRAKGLNKKVTIK